MPTQQMIDRYVGFNIIERDSVGSAIVGARLVFKLRFVKHGLSIENRRVDAIVGSMGDLAYQFVVTIFSDIERKLDFRSDTLCPKEQQVSRPKHLFLNLDLASTRLNLWHQGLGLDLNGIAMG
jgi:hypothetical protein